MSISDKQIRDVVDKMSVETISEMVWKIVASTFLLIFLSPIINVFTGAFAGLIVSLVFNDTVLKGLSAFGVHTNDLTLWQIGATLGFVGGFFRIFQK